MTETQKIQTSETPELIKVRCPHCGRLLGAINGTAEIKCRGCGTVVRARTEGSRAVIRMVAP